jgi:hypothetical protein
MRSESCKIPLSELVQIAIAAATKLATPLLKARNMRMRSVVVSVWVSSQSCDTLVAHQFERLHFCSDMMSGKSCRGVVGVITKRFFFLACGAAVEEIWSERTSWNRNRRPDSVQHGVAGSQTGSEPLLRDHTVLGTSTLLCFRTSPPPSVHIFSR